MSKLLFQPWIGQNFGQTELGRLFVVGESHYDFIGLNEFTNYTSSIISQLGNGEENNFFIEIGHLFNEIDYLDVWQKIAFANGIQHVFKESRQPKTSEHRLTVEPAIKEYLNIIKPDKMLVCSKYIWEKGLPGSITWGKYKGKLTDDRNIKESTLWEFEYEGGRCLAIGIHHPGSTNPKFRVDEWRPLLDKFLTL